MACWWAVQSGLDCLTGHKDTSLGEVRQNEVCGRVQWHCSVGHAHYYRCPAEGMWALGRTGMEESAEVEAIVVLAHAICQGMQEWCFFLPSQALVATSALDLIWAQECSDAKVLGQEQMMEAAHLEEESLLEARGRYFFA